MHEAIGDRPSVTPPVLIATCAQGAVVLTSPSVTTPAQVEAAEETAEGSLTPTVTRTSTASTPKRLRVDVVEVLQDELEWRRMQDEEREREERREAEQARQAAEREGKEERRHRELCERQERWHQEAVMREERWKQEVRAMRGGTGKLQPGMSASWLFWRGCLRNEHLFFYLVNYKVI